jgi:hypothetical protein
LVDKLFYNTVIINCIKNNITFTQYLICCLLAAKNRMAYNTYVNNVEDISVEEFNLLLVNGFLTRNYNTGDPFVDYEITEKGLAVLGNSISNSWIEEWYDLFPKGIKSGGYLVRDGKSACMKKMDKFIKAHPEFTKEDIIKATKNYVNAFKVKNYEYMRLASYFIEKDGHSTLAAECENVKTQTTSTYDPERGLKKDV